MHQAWIPGRCRRSMAFYIYKTTNSKNGKYYIGAHCGELDDDYLGSGTGLIRAINKWGRQAFTKEILCVCTNEAAMYFMEAIYVNEEEVSNRQCYNMKPGGRGGFSKDTIKAGCEAARIANTGRKRTKHWVSYSGGTKKGRKLSEQAKLNIGAAGKGRKATEETRRKLSEAAHRQWKRQKEGVPSHA